MKKVTKSELQKWINQKQSMLLIDVLPNESFQKQHIPGAINIPFKDNSGFLSAVEESAESKDQLIVLYCLNMQCDASEQAAQQLESDGFKNICRFEEGVEGWFGKSSSLSGKEAA